MDLSPKAEPVAWSVAIAAIVAALASYGFNITDQLKDLLILLGPFLIAGVIARFSVFSPKSTQLLVNEAAVTGDTDIGSPPKGK